MTRREAVEYAVKQVPQILPLEEQDVRSLCEQVLSGGNADAMAKGFLDILGHEDMAFEFVIEFNRLLAKEDPSGTAAAVAAPPQESAVSTKKPKSKKLQSLEEIDEVVKMLELTNDSETDAAKYACNCQGNRHPLFEAAPNCLSCGKIVCAKEGLHVNNCTFCGQALIPIEERIQIMEILTKEKNSLLNTSQVAKNQQVKPKKPKSYKIASGMGTNLFSEQDKLFDFIERQRERQRKRNEVLKIGQLEATPKESASLDPELATAQKRLENLLYYQDTSAERTKIIDNASDFSLSNDTQLWGSANERALALKKQQRNLKKWEQLEKERNGRKDKYVVSMNIGRDGTVTMSEVTKKETSNIKANSDGEFEDISDEEDVQNLKEIQKLKEDISTSRQLEAEKLRSNVWDYKKDLKQFEKPVYIGSSEDIENTSDKKNWKSRLQVDTSDDASLESNILAVL